MPSEFEDTWSINRFLFINGPILYPRVILHSLTSVVLLARDTVCRDLFRPCCRLPWHLQICRPPVNPQWGSGSCRLRAGFRRASTTGVSPPLVSADQTGPNPLKSHEPSGTVNSRDFTPSQFENTSFRTTEAKHRELRNPEKCDHIEKLWFFRKMSASGAQIEMVHRFSHPYVFERE